MGSRTALVRVFDGVGRLTTGRGHGADRQSVEDRKEICYGMKWFYLLIKINFS